MSVLVSGSDSNQNLKRSFLASLALHLGLLVALIIAALIPHQLHFDQTALVELQGIATSVQGSAANSAVSAGKSNTVAQKIPHAIAKTASLKTKMRVQQTAVKTEPKIEKVSLTHRAKVETVTKPDTPERTATKRLERASAETAKPQKNAVDGQTTQQPDLRQRILQKFQASGAGNAVGTAASSSQDNGISSQGTIGTDVPFPFANYLAQVQNRITDSWEQPSWLAAQNADAKAIVVFRILRDGSLAKAIVAVPSGMDALDKSALQAVQAASPLPPLPAEFKNDFLDVHLQFDLTR